MKYQKAIWAVVLCLCLGLTGCKKKDNTETNSQIKTEESAESKTAENDVQLETTDVKVFTNVKDNLPSNEQVVGVKVKVTNKTNYLLDLNNKSFTLTNAKNKEISPLTEINIDKQKYQPLTSGTIEKDQSQEGYLFYQLNPNETYQLKYQPQISAKDQNKTQDNLSSITKEVNFKANQVNTKELENLSDIYIKAVFLNDKSARSSKLANNLQTEANNYKNRVINQYQNQIFNNLERADIEKFVTDLQTEGLKRDQFSVKVASATDNEATVTVKTSTIDISKFDFSSLSNKYLNEHKDSIKTQEQFNKESQKYCLDELSKWILTSKLTVNFDNTIKLTKQENGTWLVDVNDQNGYKELGDQFGGDLDIN